MKSALRCCLLLLFTSELFAQTATTKNAAVTPAARAVDARGIRHVIEQEKDVVRLRSIASEQASLAEGAAAQAKKLADEVKKLKAEADKLTAEKASLAGETVRLRAATVQVQAELDALRQQKGTLGTDVQQLRSEIAALEDQKKKKETELAEAESRLKLFTTGVIGLVVTNGMAIFSLFSGRRKARLEEEQMKLNTERLALENQELRQKLAAGKPA